jgi:hypothetical protein
MSSDPNQERGDPFGYREYIIKRPWLSVFDQSFRVCSPDGNRVLYIRHPLLKLKDEWNFYSDDRMQNLLLRVSARKASGFKIITDVFDVPNHTLVGSVRDRGVKSWLLRDAWDVISPEENTLGEMVEESNSLLRRFVPLLLGKWHMVVNGREIFRLRQEFRFFIKEFHLTLVDETVDPRFSIACACLALMREIMREKR